MANWFTNLIKREAKQQYPVNPEFYASMFGGSRTKSGVSVSPETAMRVSTVYACVKVIAEAIGQLPVNVMKRMPDGSREKDEESSVWELMNYSPNSWQTPVEFREMMTAHCLLRGNAYAFKNRASDGRVLELLPIHPDSVNIEQLPDFSLRYFITFSTGKSFVAEQDDMFHIRGLTFDGYRGVSPISYNRENIGLSIGALEHGASVFGNGAMPGVILKHPGTISKEAHERLKDTWQNAYSGDGKFKTAILEQGMEISTVGMSNSDVQFLETRKFQRSEIASIFRVPPHKIGDLERSTNNNIEHQGIEFVYDTLMPWVRRWEQAIHRDLLPRRQRKTHCVRFQVSELLRGDLESRMNAYGKGIQWGIISANEARESENMNRREDGDTFLVPLNMTPAHMVEADVQSRIDRNSQPEQPPQEDEAEPELDEVEKGLLEAVKHINGR